MEQAQARVTPDDLLRMNGKYFKNYDLGNIPDQDLEKLAQWKESDVYRILKTYYTVYRKAWILDQMSKAPVKDKDALQLQMNELQHELTFIKEFFKISDKAVGRLKKSRQSGVVKDIK